MVTVGASDLLEGQHVVDLELGVFPSAVEANAAVVEALRLQNHG